MTFLNDCSFANNQAQNIEIEPVVSLPDTLGAGDEGRTVAYNHKLYVWDGTAWQTWGNIDITALNALVSSDIEGADDLLVLYDNSAAENKKITVNKLFTRKVTQFLYVKDAVDYQNASEDEPGAIFGKVDLTDPYMSPWEAEFPTGTPITPNTKYANWIFCLPDEWDGSTVQIKYGFLVDSETIQPGISDKVSFACAGRAYNHQKFLSQALGSYVAVSQMLDASDNSKQLITAESSNITLADAAAGTALIHLKVKRDNTISNNFTGSAMLLWCAVEYGVNKQSS